MAKLLKSMMHFEAARKVMPGGVSSPVRAFGGVGGVPPFISRAKGSRIWDVDGNEYIDYVCSWGPAILGHAHPKVLAALNEAIELGTSFGAPTEGETRLAEMIVAAVPSVEMVRFVNSGTEATMSAIRLARGVTARGKVVKFEGCYHGHSDSLLVKSGSGAATFGVPTSAGVTRSAAAETMVARYNDLESVERLMAAEGNEVAAIIVEPVAGNMGCVPPCSGFLEGLRALCTKHGSLLIFDEVMTGFRVSFGGAQELYGVSPDITTLGKIVGGGLPIGAYGASSALMERVAPSGPVYQAGTLSGNPLATAAGIKTIELLSVPGVYEKIDSVSGQLCSGAGEVLSRNGISHRINRVGSMWSIFFSEADVVDFLTASCADGGRFRRFFRFMLDRGVYLAPSPYESAFVSLAHTEDDVAETIDLVGAWAKEESGRG
ncbi:MAG TPA: glutamate-1-semialdehyde 2,1-aminomutase [bacterium]|nr:glutamate-1-semialdehyde 2,1-aminomutase [bacterium]